MTAREWKPGDVAMVTIGTVEFVAIRRYGGWTTAYGHSDIEPMLSEIVDARPLVVIDPEDREAVALILSHYHSWKWTQKIADASIDDMQAALREFANPTPPKPEEPLGDGAVVEDAMGHRWVRIAGSAVDSPPWRHRGHSGRFWDKVTAVRVLSEGVTS